jgi:hypothetical protein
MLRAVERTNNPDQQQALGADIVTWRDQEVTVSGRRKGDGRCVFSSS